MEKWEGGAKCIVDASFKEKNEQDEKYGFEMKTICRSRKAID